MEFYELEGPQGGVLALLHPEQYGKMEFGTSTQINLGIFGIFPRFQVNISDLMQGILWQKTIRLEIKYPMFSSKSKSVKKFS